MVHNIVLRMVGVVLVLVALCIFFCIAPPKVVFTYTELKLSLIVAVENGNIYDLSGNNTDISASKYTQASKSKQEYLFNKYSPKNMPALKRMNKRKKNLIQLLSLCSTIMPIVHLRQLYIYPMLPIFSQGMYFQN